MNVNFYTFSKRRNSTKQPTGTGTIIDCKLKEGTSVKNPKLTISGDVFGYNYAYIGDFGRYYFVSDVISEAKGITTYVLEEDSLASNKSAIGGTVARIAFASTLYDTEIIDNRIAVHTTKSVRGSVNSSAYNGFNTTGCYILTVYNNALTGASTGFAQSYVMDATNIAKVKAWLGDSRVFKPLVDYFLGNPLESIFGCIWVPFPYSDAPGTSTDHVVIGNQSSALYVGEYGTINAKILTGTGIVSYTATLPIHLRYTDFRKCSPYTTAAVYLPGIGLLDVNINDWVMESNIYISYSIEYATGNVSYIFFDSNARILQTSTCNVASECPLGQVTGDGNKMVNAVSGSVMGVIGGAAGGGMAGGPVGAIAGAAGGLLKSAADVVLAFAGRGTSIAGGTGGRMASIFPEIRFIEVSVDTEDPDNADYIAKNGRPVAATHAISTHSGYVECEGASVSIGGESWERDQINSFLNGGFFYE